MKNQKFHIIRAYPAGMCSCLMHVVNELLYSELTNRIPIVYWKERSLYYQSTTSKEKDIQNNSFEYCFKPVSNYSIQDILRKNNTYFPSVWTDSNIFTDTVSSSHTALPVALDSQGIDADVLVSSVFRRMEDLQTLIPQDNYLSTLSKEELWYHFYSKYISLKNNINKKITSFYNDHMLGENVLGLHIRKTDKSSEQPTPYDRKFIRAINRYLSFHNDAKIFIATDSERTLIKFKNIYKDRLIYTNSIRSVNSTGVHFSEGNGISKAEQIITDVYLLSKCDYFIGSLSSNIAYVVLYMLTNPVISKKQSTLISHGFYESLERKMYILVSRKTMLIKRIFKKILKLFYN